MFSHKDVPCIRMNRIDITGHSINSLLSSATIEYEDHA